MRRGGFTLVEMLVVLAVMSILTGLVLSVSRGDEREVHVRSAAHELAGVLRSARTMAMQTKGVYAVAFNIQNTPDSSGRVLSNGSGGHWYRILGPRDDLMTNGSDATTQDTTAKATWDGVRTIPWYDPFVNARNGNGFMWNTASNTAPVSDFLAAVERSWVGDRRVLPAGKVRFVALTDMDNGNYMEEKNVFPTTYPRPWFGWWDATSKRLYAWGGYDPEVAMTTQASGGANSFHSYNVAKSYMSRTLSLSGFFYEGFDGLITGCRNPTDRMVQEDITGDGWITTADFATPKSYALWRQNEPRPLINGAWQDYMVLFRPDGTATTSWMSLRHKCSNNVHSSSNIMFYDPGLLTGTVTWGAPASASQRNFLELGPGDMASRNAAYEATSYPNRSGYSFITLGPDADPAAHQFPTAIAAFRSLMPLYRVGVSPYGEVVVVKVAGAKPDAKTYDTALAGADWNVKAKTDAYWYGYSLVESGTRTWRGTPISDVLTPEMLAGRIWWWR